MQSLKFHNLKTYAALLILVRLLCVITFMYMEIPIGIGPGSDAHEYKFVAHSIINGDGFLSNENNSWERKYLGDNYYYCNEPGYPAFIALFYIFMDSDQWVTIISNTLLYFILLLLMFFLCTHFEINNKLSSLVMLGIIFNGGINVHANLLLTEVLRIAAFMLFFWYVLIWYKKKNIDYRDTIILGLFTAIVILFRTPYVLFIIPVYYLMLYKVLKNKLKHVVIYAGIIFIVLLPWMIRNYTAFGYFNIDPRFYRGFTVQKEVLGTYRITDNDLFQEIKKMNEEEKGELFKKSDSSVPGLIKAYGLRLKELFRLYPSGGDFATPILQVISALFNIPYILGLLVLYLAKTFRRDKFWQAWKIFIICFVGFHLVAAGPHARYFLPLVPLGYIILGYYLSERFFHKGVVPNV
ncbi:MAG: hypothetical protein ISS28_08445 [Candidatus Cloacimonetes bacterium]|nr:hypothetical protein [Candidatus Cloacimonadota bacterium]